MIAVSLNRLFAATKAQKDMEICLRAPFNLHFSLIRENSWHSEGLLAAKSLFNKTAIILSIAKCDEIGKIAHLV